MRSEPDGTASVHHSEPVSPAVHLAWHIQPSVFSRCTRSDPCLVQLAYMQSDPCPVQLAYDLSSSPVFGLNAFLLAPLYQNLNPVEATATSGAVLVTAAGLAAELHCSRLRLTRLLLNSIYRLSLPTISFSGTFHLFLNSGPTFGRHCKSFDILTAYPFPVPRLALTSHTVLCRPIHLHLFCHELGASPGQWKHHYP